MKKIAMQALSECLKNIVPTFGSGKSFARACEDTIPLPTSGLGWDKGEARKPRKAI